MPNKLLLAPLLLLPACVTEPGDEPSLAAHQTRTIRGRDVDRHHLASGALVDHPIDLSTTPITAYVERAGGFEARGGVGTSDGRFAIAGVPHGRYWLAVGGNFYWTGEREVDIGLHQLGRPDATPSPPGTGLSLSIGGLVPTSAGDDLQLTSANAAVGFYSTASFFNPITANPPAPGDTALVDALFPFDASASLGTATFPLVEASRGDRLTVTQLVPQQSGAVSYNAVARALTTSVEMAPGTATAVTGTLATPPAQSTTITYRQDAFEAHAAAIGAGATPLFSSVFLDANPLGDRLASGTPDLAYTTFAPAAGDQTFTFSYRNPFPSSWRRYLAAPTIFQVPLTVPDGAGGTTTASTFVAFFAQAPVRRQAIELAPAISPARDLSLDGQPMHDGLTVGATPVLSWQAPALGDARAYTIRVLQLGPTPPFATQVARLVVTGDVTTVRLPPTVLVPGQTYALQLNAVATSEDAEDEQLEPGFVTPSGAAPTVTASFVVE